jgi:membrane associated rhomboid family serine protease
MTLARPTASNLLCGVTALVSIVILLGGWLPQAAVTAGFIPARIQAELLPPDVWAVPAWLTPLSTLFVHGDLFGLGFNLLMLAYLGGKTETAIGWSGVLLLYAMGAYASSAALWLVAPGSIWPLLGMNGALSAVIAAYALLYAQPKTGSLGPLSARSAHVLQLAIAWTVISAMIALIGPTPRGLSLGEQVLRGAAAPVGGFLAGLLVARPLLLWRWRKA